MKSEEALFCVLTYIANIAILTCYVQGVKFKEDQIYHFFLDFFLHTRKTTLTVGVIYFCLPPPLAMYWVVACQGQAL